MYLGYDGSIFSTFEIGNQIIYQFARNDFSPAPLDTSGCNYKIPQDYKNIYISSCFLDPSSNFRSVIFSEVETNSAMLQGTLRVWKHNRRPNVDAAVLELWEWEWDM